MQMTVVKYDYRLATSTPRCDIKTYFARTDVEMKKRYNPAKKGEWRYILIKNSIIHFPKIAQSFTRTEK